MARKTDKKKLQSGAKQQDQVVETEEEVVVNQATDEDVTGDGIYEDPEQVVDDQTEESNEDNKETSENQDTEDKQDSAGNDEDNTSETKEEATDEKQDNDSVSQEGNDESENQDEDNKGDDPKTPIQEVKPDILNKANLPEFLAKPGMSIEDKLKKIQEKAVPEFSTLVGKLLDYQKHMSIDAVMVTDKAGASYNHGLFNSIIKALNSDYETFKIKFDIINLAFFKYSKDAYNEYNLSRFDTSWTWGDSKLDSYLKLTSVIATLCNKSTRSKKLSRINFQKLRNGAIVTEQMINNLSKYYSE